MAFAWKQAMLPIKFSFPSNSSFSFILSLGWKTLQALIKHTLKCRAILQNVVLFTTMLLTQLPSQTKILTWIMILVLVWFDFGPCVRDSRSHLWNVVGCATTEWGWLCCSIASLPKWTGPTHCSLSSKGYNFIFQTKGSHFLLRHNV